VAAGKIGRAVITGVVPVRLVVDPTHLYASAEILPGETDQLRNVPHGSARVLWIQPYDPSDPPSLYLRWAIVRLDDGDAQAHMWITSNVRMRTATSNRSHLSGLKLLFSSLPG
jgi:hypothetical protein